MIGSEFSIEYKKGAENKAVDSLSKKEHDSLNHDDNVQLASLAALSFPGSTWLEELKRVYPVDRITHQKLKELWQGSSSDSSLTMKHGVLFKKCRIYVPNNSNLKLRILNFTHAYPLAGHSGLHKPLQRARSDFYWPGLKAEVKLFF